MSNTLVPSDLGALSIEALVERLFSLIYEPAFSRLHKNIPDHPESLRVLMLVANFDTEVSMSGILGFLENSTGQYLSETIEAFQLIQAKGTAATLRRVQRVMAEHRVTTGQLRARVNEQELFTVKSFAQVHGPEAVAMAAELQSADRDLYIHNQAAAERPISLLCQYLEPRRAELLAAIDAA